MAAIRSALPILVLAACLQAFPASAAERAESVAAATEALEEFARACGRAEALWPAELCGPLVLVDPRTRLAVANRPDPDGRFDSRDAAFVGEWPADMPVANTAIDWDGTQWAMAMLPLPADAFARLRLLAHESFHRIQPELGLEASDPMAVHLDEEQGRLWLRLELRALARALQADGEEARTATLDGLLFRRQRNLAYPESAAVERGLEAHEGLAEYTGTRFALDALGAEPAAAARAVEAFQQRPTYVRSLGYGTGPALGMLLDRYAPGWRDDTGPVPDLAGRLAAALGVDPAGRDDGREDAGRRALVYGLDEIAGEERERAARLAVERARYRDELVDGPVLVLGLPQRMLMFNPNTVLSLGDAGNVYPGAILIGPWGRLTLKEGAALVTADRDRAWVAAAGLADAAPGSAVDGPGWSLELAPGWRLVPATRPGDFRLADE